MKCLILSSDPFCSLVISSSFFRGRRSRPRRVMCRFRGGSGGVLPPENFENGDALDAFSGHSWGGARVLMDNGKRPKILIDKGKTPFFLKIGPSGWFSGCGIANFCPQNLSPNFVPECYISSPKKQNSDFSCRAWVKKSWGEEIIFQTKNIRGQNSTFHVGLGWRNHAWG